MTIGPSRKKTIPSKISLNGIDENDSIVSNLSRLPMPTPVGINASPRSSLQMSDGMQVISMDPFPSSSISAKNSPVSSRPGSMVNNGNELYIANQNNNNRSSTISHSQQSLPLPINIQLYRSGSVLSVNPQYGHNLSSPVLRASSVVSAHSVPSELNDVPVLINISHNKTDSKVYKNEGQSVENSVLTADDHHLELSQSSDEMYEDPKDGPNPLFKSTTLNVSKGMIVTLSKDECGYGDGGKNLMSMS